MSLLDTVRWEHMIGLGTYSESRERKLVEVLKTPREWAWQSFGEFQSGLHVSFLSALTSLRWAYMV